MKKAFCALPELAGALSRVWLAEHQIFSTGGVSSPGEIIPASAKSGIGPALLQGHGRLVMRGESLAAARMISERFGLEFGEALRAVSEALDSPGREVRALLPDERRGKSSVSMKFIYGISGHKGLLVHSFRKCTGGYVPLGQRTFRGEEENGASERLSAIEQRCRLIFESRQREREEKESLARLIDREGISAERAGAFGSLAVPDYALRKGLSGFCVPGRRRKFMPCPSVRRAARTYGFRRKIILLRGTPFWSLRDFRTGEVRGIQFKFWSFREGIWLTRTLGGSKGCWVQIQPRSGDSARYGTVLCEGLATAWAVHELLGGSVRAIASLGTAGLTAAAVRARELWPKDRLSIVADMDAEFQGERAAANAAQMSGAEVRLPIADDNGAETSSLRGRGFDAWNLWALRRGREILKGIDGLRPAEILE